MDIHNDRTSKILHDRVHAAYLLAEKLHQYKSNTHAVIVAIPNGGVPVGYYLASLLELPLRLIPCRKITHPADDTKTIGSVCLDELVLHANHDVPQDYIQHQVILIRNSLCYREKLYTNNQEPISLNGKTVILVDDRVKTDDTILACIKSIQHQLPDKIIVTAPVMLAEIAYRLQSEGYEAICLIMPQVASATEHFFDEFNRITDEDVLEFLRKANHEHSIRQAKVMSDGQHKSYWPY